MISLTTLNLKADIEPVRVLGMDPGSNLGLTVTEWDLNEESNKKVLTCFTLPAKKAVEKCPVAYLTLSNQARYLGAAVVIKEMVEEYDVIAIACENTYFSGMAQAFRSLTEQDIVTLTEIRRAYPHIPLAMPSASTVKKFVNVSGKSGDKDLMKKALLTRNDLSYGDLKLDSADEHSIDSLAISLWLFNTIKGGVYE